MDEQEHLTFSKLLETQFNNKKFKYLYPKFKYTKLLYCSKRDGLTAKVFHDKCDGISNTITIVHSEYNHVFGGFTKIPWSSPNRRQEFKDASAFLFLLRSQFNGKPKIIPQTKRGHYDISCDKTTGPLFSPSVDLKIYPEGRSYCHPYRFNFDGNELCGGDKFLSTKSIGLIEHYYEIQSYEVFNLY